MGDFKKGTLKDSETLRQGDYKTAKPIDRETLRQGECEQVYTSFLRLTLVLGG